MTTDLIPTRHDLILAGPVGSLDAYIGGVRAIPVLSREEEQRLARSFREHDDLDAARQLVVSQLRFVVHIARGYVGYGLPLGDLIQEGNVGLMKAVKRFDPDVGVRLVSFAVHWIRAEIHEYVLRNWRLVKIATTKAQRKLFFNLRKAKKYLGWLSADETEAIATDLGVSAGEVTEMEKRLAGNDLAFDSSPHDDEEKAYAPAHYLPASTPDPADVVEADDWHEQANERLGAALENLDQRSREILQARWLADKKATLQVLAERYGVSAERIRQIEQRAIKLLREDLVTA
ncbi:MAG: RNA polymerase sigma factor RpoH [Gammaproteobacteria bacterium]